MSGLKMTHPHGWKTSLIFIPKGFNYISHTANKAKESKKKIDRNWKRQWRSCWWIEISFSIHCNANKGLSLMKILIFPLLLFPRFVTKERKENCWYFGCSKRSFDFMDGKLPTWQSFVNLTHLIYLARHEGGDEEAMEIIHVMWMKIRFGSS